jgi:transcription elongation factor Elf1
LDLLIVVIVSYLEMWWDDEEQSEPINLYTQPAYNSRVIHGFGYLPPGIFGQRISPPAIFEPFLYGGPDLPLTSGPSAKENNKVNTSMKSHSIKPEIAGTRSGYVIRFTCPLCNAENNIVNKTPRDHYKLARDAACTRCRKRCVVTTPAMTQNPGYSTVLVKLPVTK